MNAFCWIDESFWDGNDLISTIIATLGKASLQTFISCLKFASVLTVVFTSL